MIFGYKSNEIWDRRQISLILLSELIDFFSS